MAKVSIKKGRGQRSVTDELNPLAEREFQYRIAERFGRSGEVNDPVFVVADWGNAFWKQQLCGDARTRTVMANRVTVIDESQWQQTCHRAKFSAHRFSDTLLFGVRSRGDKGDRRVMYVAAGNSAHNYGTPMVMTDDIKYDYNLYWSKVVAANLLRLFPEGHNNIVIALAHPMKSIGQRELMMNLTGGTHTVETVSGKTVRFVVREVLPWDEPVGGAIAWAVGATGDDLAYNKHGLRPGDMVMLADTGGGVSSMNRLQVDYDADDRLVFVPVYNPRQSPTIEAGVVHVEQNLRDILLQDRSEFRGMASNLDARMLSEGIRTGKITLSGGTVVDVSAEVRMAESVLLEPLFKTYNGAMAGGRPFRVIVGSGGGQHLYHERFIGELYKHGTVELAAPLVAIHFANLIGGDVMMRQWIDSEIAHV